MIVTPQSRLCIMRGIPWTNDYKHTRYFTSESQQNTYMTGMVVREFFNFTYIREQNVIRVPASADDLYNCNYLRYMNETFGTKWFYAFITSVKYINPETAEISFEIDYFQTWWFDVNLGHCYVEREHVADDTVGLHTLDEGLGTGEVVPIQTFRRFWDWNSADPNPSLWGRGFKIAMSLKPSLVGSLLTGDTIEYDEHQIRPCTKVYDFDANGTDINDVIDDLLRWLKDNSFTGYEVNKCYMFPKEFQYSASDVRVDGNGIKRPTLYPYFYTGDKLPYTPKNNKLFCYPYTKLIVNNSQGQNMEYRWENTSTGDVRFRLLMNISNKPSCILKPVNYCDSDNIDMYDLPINDFPEVQLTQYDSLNVQNIFNGITGAIGSLLTLGASNMVSGGLNAGSSLGSSILGVALDNGDKPTYTAGDNVKLKWRHIGYQFYVMGITGENAEAIDTYLTRFGYKVNVIKVPELTSRKRWNYVKTKECEIHAKSNNGAPTDALQKIQDMFNAGVTLWHVNDVGNFDGDNGIVS